MPTAIAYAVATTATVAAGNTSTADSSGPKACYWSVVTEDDPPSITLHSIASSFVAAVAKPKAADESMMEDSCLVDLCLGSLLISSFAGEVDLGQKLGGEG